MKNRLKFPASMLLILLALIAVHGQPLATTASPAKTAARDPRSAAIEALKRLEADVIVYRSLADFEAGGRLARVPLSVFEAHLQSVSLEVEPLLAQMPAAKSKLELTNALDSYRDGVFWWRQIDSPRVISVSALAYTQSNHTPAEAAFLSSIPYTVAINWRQAQKYLRRAESLRDR
jgi:hypothetical protein